MITNNSVASQAELSEIQERIRRSGSVTITMRRVGDSYWFAGVLEGSGVLDNPRDIAFAANLINREALKQAGRRNTASD